ncbi:MAG: DedA family protein [Candidatus Moranbacteria bacterium]|nr:DedA family protein [Candidatus Moranbacteria bacterium]
MDFLLQNLLIYLALYKYTTVFVISFLAAFIIPIPSGSLLMAASAYARFGYFDIYTVVLISIIANILGDNAGYFLARKYGYEVLSKFGFKRILNSKKFKEIEVKYNNHPGFIIFVSRFEVLSTLSVNLLSGISKTPYRKYFLHEFFGSISQVLTYSMIGYIFADNWESINSTMGRVLLVIALLIVISVLSFGKKLIKKSE